MRFAVGLLGIGAVFLLSGCGGASGDSDAESPGTIADTGAPRYTIVTTTAMVRDIVEQVAGDRAEVVGIIGTGVDPHLFQPTTSDSNRLREADVVFYSGLMLEAGLDTVLTRANEAGKPVFGVTAGIDPSYLLHPDEFEGHPDPHVWNDVGAWSECVTFVAAKLAEYDADNADYYRQNAEDYRAELAELDAYARRAVASVPAEQRHLVTAHDAFGYFGRAYGIEVHSVVGITTESEAGVEDINMLVEFLVENRIPAVFVESSVSERNIDAVIEGAAEQGWQVHKGGTLFSDAMGREGTYEGTYIGMMDHNATIVARALGGDAPERGFRGELSTEFHDQ